MCFTVMKKIKMCIAFGGQSLNLSFIVMPSLLMRHLLRKADLIIFGLHRCYKSSISKMQGKTEL